MRPMALTALVCAALCAPAPASASPPSASLRPAAQHAAAMPAAGGRGLGRGIGRLTRVLIRAGVPPVVVYSLLGAAVAGGVGFRMRGARRPPSRGEGESPRLDDALARKLRDEPRDEPR